MKEIISWLLDIENLAENIYRDASLFIKEDKNFYNFINQLAEDEALHQKIMTNAAEYLQDHALKDIVAITFDKSTKYRVESPFIKVKKLLSTEKLTREAILDCIVTAEYSEWNTIFLYVINSLLKISKEFQYVAAKIQQHEKRIEIFLGSLPEGKKYLEKILTLPEIWKERFLIVDDSEPVLQFLKDIFRPMAIVETARNGNEGLTKLSEQYFDIIISDVQMPVMNGIEFYKQAAKKDPNLSDRFIFFTSDPTYETFFKKNNLMYLSKPTPFDELKQFVNSIRKKNLNRI